MITTQNTTDLSKFLSKRFKDKGLSQSEIIEAIANFNGYSDWNTNKASENKTSAHDLKTPGWSNDIYIHVDNGGIKLAFNQEKKILFLESSFFGYTVNSHYFHFTTKEIQKMFHQLKNHSFEHNDSFFGNGWKIHDYGLFIFDEQQNLVIGLHPLAKMISNIKNIEETLIQPS